MRRISNTQINNTKSRFGWWNSDAKFLSMVYIDIVYSEYTENTGRLWDVSHGPFLSQSHKAEKTWTYLCLLNSLVRWLAFDSGVISDIWLVEACCQYTWKTTQERDEISWSVPGLGTVSKIKTNKISSQVRWLVRTDVSIWAGSLVST